MCGRYVLYEKENGELSLRYKTINKIQLANNYNVAPSFNMPVITKHSPNQLEIMKWGLIPFWAKDPRIGYKMINARAETITTAPSFRVPIKKQRCLVPARGFYEWKKIDAKNKTPYFIHLKNNEIFSFAGIYDIWKDPEGVEIKSFTIITCEPNNVIENIHNRMPVILDKDDEESWLDIDSDINSVVGLLKPFGNSELEVYEVSSEVNSPRNNSGELIKIRSNQL